MVTQVRLAQGETTPNTNDLYIHLANQGTRYYMGTYMGPTV